MVESAVASVTKELNNLLNGDGTESDFASDPLRFGMEAEVATPLMKNGLVLRALTFLASYGIYTYIYI